MSNYIGPGTSRFLKPIPTMDLKPVGFRNPYFYLSLHPFVCAEEAQADAVLKSHMLSLFLPRAAPPTSKAGMGRAGHAQALTANKHDTDGEDLLRVGVG